MGPVPKQAGRTLELLEQLIACPSITPASAGAIEIATTTLAAAGFACQRLDAGGVCNLHAHYGTGEPSFLFAGHVDVVPPGDRAGWDHDPFVPIARDGLLYGRGACDMKAGVAAILAAAEELGPPPAGRLGVLLTSDEEGPAQNGTRHAVAELRRRGINYAFGLIGEPCCTTSLGDTMRTGRRGSLTGTVTVIGEQGHVAYPEYMKNPIPALVRSLATLGERSFTPPPGLEPTLLSVVNLNADSGANNVVPAQARATLNFRYSIADQAGDLQDWTTSLFAQTELACTWSWQHNSEPYLTPTDSCLAQALATTCQELLGRKPQPSAGGGASDGCFLHSLCTEIIEFGPVGRSMHKVNEHVRIADLNPLAAIYATLASRLLGITQG